MSRLHRFLLLIGAFVLVAALAVWPGRWPSSAYANVTLVSFTASPVPGKPDIDVEWETATEFYTVGFFVTRSASADGTYARVSGFIPHTGDTVVGAPYGWTDRNLVSNRSYWYELEEITQGQGSNFYGPISVTLTFTATPTATPTTQPATEVVKPTALPSRVVATPHLATGATITPRPTAASSSANPVAFAASPTLESRVTNSQPPVTALPAALDASTTVASAPPPVVAGAAQVAEPTLLPTKAVPAAAAPVIVVTESASPTAATGTVSSPALMLIAAAFLFLGVAFIILRQARQ
jgi:hypothetical protein